MQDPLWGRFSPFGPEPGFSGPQPYYQKTGIGFDQTGFSPKRVDAGPPLEAILVHSIPIGP